MQSVYYDIRFNAIVPTVDGIIRLIINLEAQNQYSPGYPLIKRGIYYGSRMISAQSETVFTKSHYEKIQREAFAFSPKRAAVLSANLHLVFAINANKFLKYKSLVVIFLRYISTRLN